MAKSLKSAITAIDNFENLEIYSIYSKTYLSFRFLIINLKDSVVMSEKQALRGRHGRNVPLNPRCSDAHSEKTQQSKINLF